MRAVREVWLAMTAVDIKITELFEFFQRTRGAIYPRQCWIAERLRVSERTVRRSIAHLRSLGIIQVQAQRSRDAQGHIRAHANRYRLHGLAGAFVRGLFTRLTERPTMARKTRVWKSVERPTLSLVENPRFTEQLAAIPLLKAWWERGRPAPADSMPTSSA